MSSSNYHGNRTYFVQNDDIFIPAWTGRDFTLKSFYKSEGFFIFSDCFSVLKKDYTVCWLHPSSQLEIKSPHGPYWWFFWQEGVSYFFSISNFLPPSNHLSQGFFVSYRLISFCRWSSLMVDMSCRLKITLWVELLKVNCDLLIEDHLGWFLRGCMRLMTANHLIGIIKSFLNARANS